ncbi:MAG: sigma 54-interacting transcriptional regulator [Acidobacteriota bacterium]
MAGAELFGAERGAYTGADRRRAGHFEQAHGGTLFLDEIGETPLEVQALLLRTMETGEVRAVGGSRSSNPDLRILSATDADLEAAIASDRFRAPLLHRLSGYVLRLPPLRTRRDDFGRLFMHFLRRELEAVDQAHRLAPRPRPWLPALLVARLAAWSWPGNVRQLANVARQLVIANRQADPATRFDEVEALLSQDGTPGSTDRRHRTAPAGSARKRAGELREEEVLAALRSHDFRPAAAADALGIPRSSIYDLMKRIPGLRKASDLTLEEIDAARAQHGPSLEAVATALEVSQRALRRRLGQLES